jgi:hypothetical protein
VDVYDVLVLETADDVRNGIAFPDVAKELVSQPLPSARAPHQSCDVHEVDRRGDDAFAADHLGHGDQAFVRNSGDT